MARVEGRLVIRLVCGLALAELVDCSLEARSQLLSRAPASIMEEDNYGVRGGHMVVDSDHVQAVLSQRLQHRSDFALEHRNVAGDLRVFICPGEGGPGVQPHPRIDLRTAFFHPYVVAAQGDLVDGTGLLAFVAHDLHNFRGVQAALRGRVTRRRALVGWCGGDVADQVQRWLYLLSLGFCLFMALDGDKKKPRCFPAAMVVSIQ